MTQPKVAPGAIGAGQVAPGALGPGQLTPAVNQSIATPGQTVTSQAAIPGGSGIVIFAPEATFGTSGDFPDAAASHAATLSDTGMTSPSFPTTTSDFTATYLDPNAQHYMYATLYLNGVAHQGDWPIGAGPVPAGARGISVPANAHLAWVVSVDHPFSGSWNAEQVTLGITLTRTP